MIKGEDKEDKENPGERKEESRKKFISRGSLKKESIKEERRVVYQE